MTSQVIFDIVNPDAWSDPRYAIQLEWCGRPTARYVIRFCDAFVSQHESRQEALGAAAYYEDCRRRSFYHDNTPRRLWSALCSTAHASWIKNPTPRDWN